MSFAWIGFNDQEKRRCVLIVNKENCVFNKMNRKSNDNNWAFLLLLCALLHAKITHEAHLSYLILPVIMDVCCGINDDEIKNADCLLLVLHNMLA